MKSLFVVLCLCVLVFWSRIHAEESPYIPNMWDNRILEKAEKEIARLAELGEKEKLVQMIWTCKTQLGILTDTKSQYILFELGRLVEEHLPTAIYVAAQKSTTIEDISTWTVQQTLPEENTWNTISSWTENTSFLEEGKASYYANSLQWNNTANWDKFDNSALTAAHKTLPFNSRVKVINTKNNLRVIVRINDRWPFTPWRVIDLSQAAFKAINNDSLSAWILDVHLEVVEE